MITLGLVGYYLSLICREGKDRANQRRRIFSFVKSDIILALAVSIKPYTLLFGLCILIQAQGRFFAQMRHTAWALARCLLLVVLLSVISLALLYQGDPVTGYRELHYWQNQFRDLYVIEATGDVFPLSLCRIGKVAP